MNDVDLDALARRAAADTLAEARSVAESKAALARLLADSTQPAPRAAVIPYHGPIREAERRPRWKIVAVAAVLAVFVGGIGYALVQGSGTIEVSGPAAGGTGTGTGTGTQATSPRVPTASSAATPPSPAATSAPVATAVSPTVPNGDPTNAPSPTATPSAPADPADGFVVPVLVPFGLGDLPYLLPDPAPAPDRALRGEEVWEVPVPTLSQLWVRADSAGLVDAMVQITTQSPPADPGRMLPVDIAGWDLAGATEMATGYAQVTLSDDELSVRVWAKGLTQDDVVAIARALRADGSTWRADPLETDRWTTIQATWSSGAATRSTTVLDPDGDVALELMVGLGTDAHLFAGVLQSGGELRVVDVGGRPGVLGRAGVSGLVVVRDDGVMVVVNSRDPDADLATMAGSLSDLDRGEWEAATTPWPEGADGCIGLFC